MSKIISNMTKHIPSSDNSCKFLTWGFLCCGGLPILGILIGILLVIPITIIISLTYTTIAIIFMFPEMGHIYYAIITTHHIGPNLKVICSSVAWILVLIYPIITLLVSTIVGICVGLFGPCVDIFENSGYFFWETIYHVFKIVFQMIEWFWELNFEHIFEFLREFRTSPDGSPFDIKLHMVPACILTSFVGFWVDGICIGCIILIKSPLILGKTYYYVWHSYMSINDIKWQLFSFIPMIVLNIILPLLWIITILLIIVVGFFAGVYVVYPTYTKGIKEGFKGIWVVIKKSHEWSNEYLGIKTCNYRNNNVV